MQEHRQGLKNTGYKKYSKVASVKMGLCTVASNIINKRRQGLIVFQCIEYIYSITDFKSTTRTDFFSKEN